MTVVLALSAAPSILYAQAPPAATDVYHVMFVKAAPGQAAALAKAALTRAKEGPR